MSIISRNSLRALAALAAVLASAPASGDAGATGNGLLQDGDSVPVALIPADVFLRAGGDPTSNIWSRVPEWRVRLEPAPAVHPSVELRRRADETGTDLRFSVASDRDRLYVRLRWNDASRDTETGHDRFRDGVAVEFALAGENSSYVMGTPEAPVNIWYWRSDSETAEDLAAGGVGSLTALDDQILRADGVYEAAANRADSEWLVVISRRLEAYGRYQAVLNRGGKVPVAFAVWQGSMGQRDGHKNASTGWLYLDFRSLSGG